MELGETIAKAKKNALEAQTKYELNEKEFKDSL